MLPTEDSRRALAERLSTALHRTRALRQVPLEPGDVLEAIEALRQPAGVTLAEELLPLLGVHDASRGLGKIFVDAVDDSDDPWAEVMRVAIANMQPEAWADALNAVRCSLHLPQFDAWLSPVVDRDESSSTDCVSGGSAASDRCQEACFVAEFGFAAVYAAKARLAAAIGINPIDIVLTRMDGALSADGRTV